MSWFDAAWPWVGLCLAAGLLALLFLTSLLGGEAGLPRWRDPVWLGWLVAPVYMIHQAEEYGINLLGAPRAFPAELCRLVFAGAGPCPIPPVFYTAVNVPLTWLAMPLAAIVARRLPLVGLGFFGLLLANGLTHVVGSLLAGTYGSGTATALLLFVPLAAWAVSVCIARFGPADLAVMVASGILIQGVLMASVLLFLRGAIGEPLLVAVQVGNAFVTPAIIAGWSLLAKPPTGPGQPVRRA